MARIHSYVVRYDSGFAPNPFFNFCTLATCKADIRQRADVGDWVIGSGSDDRNVRRGGRLVYAMRVTEHLPFQEYYSDPRFEKKKPYRNGSRKQSCGDNIYFRNDTGADWSQLDSFHSEGDGSRHDQHVRIDTAVDRVLISDDFVYFGGEGPSIPDSLVDERGYWLCKAGVGRVCFNDEVAVAKVVEWIRSIGMHGYQGAPYEWISLRKK